MDKNFKISHFYVLFLAIFSIVINQYFGYVGILPIDSFLIFNSGFDLLNGYFPFKDYWTIKEPFIDLVQAIFFKIFGVSWFSYVLHASFFNCIITISTFFVLKNWTLKKLLFFYSLCVSILTYPTAGTPFSDHHTLILCLLSFYTFILAIYEKNIYWFLTPLLLGFAFMSKQAPTVYITVLITLISLVYFIKEKKISNLIYPILGIIFTFFIFFTLIFLAKIDLKDFFYQYFLYPQSLGGTRFDWLFPFEFKRIVWRYKLQYFSVAILIYIFFKYFFKKIKIDFSDILIIFSFIFFCFLTIMPQLMTINAIFIYCLIPVFSGFSQVYNEKYLKRKNIK